MDQGKADPHSRVSFRSRAILLDPKIINESGLPNQRYPRFLADKNYRRIVRLLHRRCIFGGAVTHADCGGQRPAPRSIDEWQADSLQPVSLLETPEKYHGQWIRIKASTVRITRVTVTDLVRRKQLGQDHYFQIDASGDLGDYIIQLARVEGDSGEPIRMSGSYPVSLVAAELPDSLQQQLDETNAVVSLTSHPVSVDGFFYRLWSYKNEFMTREGGGKQVGPLIVVANWRSISQPEQAGDGVEVIGYLLAIGIFASIVATILWTRRHAKEDAKIRENARDATTIDL